MSHPLVSHEEVERNLASADLEIGGGEVHGLLCGLLCCTNNDAFELWLAELLPQPEEGDLLLEECRLVLRRLYSQTLDSMTDSGMEFTLLMPADEKPMRLRASCVRDWCAGFLYGLGLAGGVKEGALSENTREALADISEITRMDVNATEEGDETEEEALMQVEEFLRVAAMLVFDDLAEIRVSGS